MTSLRFKYPRTPHLPWSPGASHDDVFLVDTANFVSQEVIVTEKLDGENTSMYPDHIHARSIDSAHHPSRTWVKQLHGSVAHLIPDGWRLCGENMYAQHSVVYEALESYFYLFAVWDEHNNCLSWQETEEWAALLGLHMPPVLYRGVWSEEQIQGLNIDPETCEGYVVRTATGFAYQDFANHVGKYVRHNHVQTDQHWMHSEVIPNGLAEREA